MNNRSIGRSGEQLALDYLLSNGFQCVEKNVFSRHGEIDLVIKKEGILYFVEVKYRRTLKYGTPKEAMTPVKIMRLKKLALAYIQKHYQGDYQPFKISFLGILAIKDATTYEFIENILL